MIARRRPRALPPELTADARITARVRRLVTVSVVALGVIWALAVATLDLPTLLESTLAVGWVLMPVVLAASLSWPILRYLLVVPATLESAALVTIAIGWRPAEPLSAIGWLLITAGILFGGTLGLWLWYRVLPVPALLDDPYASRRWTLVAVHVALVVIGISLVATSLPIT
jgi:hypothetical protein